MYAPRAPQVANLVAGVTGFREEVESPGSLSRSTSGQNSAALGYSHDVVYAIPEALRSRPKRPTIIAVTIPSGRQSRPIPQLSSPEPLRQGVKYSDEFIFRKEGKKK